MELLTASTELKALHDELLAVAPSEGAAFLAVEPSRGRLVLRSYRVFDQSEMDGDAFGELTLREEVQVRELAAIKREGHAAIEVHTHPFSKEAVDFSPFDEEQLPNFARYVRNKLPGRPFGALVFGSESYAGRLWSDSGVEPLTLKVIGDRRSIPRWLDDNSVEPTDNGLPARFDRQVRALGPEGQRRLASLKIAVVGLGGTGSLVVQQLAHLGIRNFVFVEDDRVEESNLARLAGATWWDAPLHRKKTAVARRLVRRLAPGAQIHATGSLRRIDSLEAVATVDLIIGCVDNDGARLILSEIAAANLVPYLDIGVGIEGEGEPKSIGGRIAFYLPGGPCLACADELDFAEAAEDLETEALRKIRLARGYASDRRVEPALMPLNTVLVGLAMIEVLAFATGVRHVIPFSRYDALDNRLVPQRVLWEEECPVCRPAFGMGDRQGVERYALEH